MLRVHQRSTQQLKGKGSPGLKPQHTGNTEYDSTCNNICLPCHGDVGARGMAVVLVEGDQVAHKGQAVDKDAADKD